MKRWRTRAREGRQFVPDQSPSRTRLLRLVPRRKPEPAFSFCRTAPVNLRDFPVAGSVTLPVNKPLAVERVSESLLLLRLATLLFAMAMALVRSFGRLPPLKTICVPVRLIIGL